MTTQEKSKSPKKGKAKITQQNKAADDSPRGVIVLCSIPHGFYEREMRSYFSQFGKVTNIRVSRSRKTGGSRGYAFIEFQYDDVAKIVAESMNNYLMFDKMLKCKYIPPKEVKPNMFNGSKIRRRTACEIYRSKYNAPKSEAKEKVILKKRNKKLKKTLNKLSEMGIDFKFNFQPESSIDDSNSAEDSTNNKSHMKLNEEQIKEIVEDLNRKLSQTSPGGTFTQILEVDDSDTEISFRTPPNSVKINRRKVTNSMRKQQKK